MPEDTRRKQKILTGFVVVFAVVIIALVVHNLSGKTKQSAAATGGADTSASGITSGGASTSTTSVASNNAAYKDGTYTASESYATPGGSEDIGVTVTIKSNAITDVSLQQNANNHDSREYQSMFEEGYKTYVVGKPLNSIHVSRVSGASLTTEGFTTALEHIKSQAQQSS